MLPQIIVAALLGSRFVAGYVVLQENTPVPMLVEPERWSYENCGKFCCKPICHNKSQSYPAMTKSLCFQSPLGTDDYLIELKEISIKPDPPKPGEDLEVTAKGYVKQTLEVRCSLQAI